MVSLSEGTFYLTPDHSIVVYTGFSGGQFHEFHYFNRMIYDRDREVLVQTAQDVVYDSKEIKKFKEIKL